MLFSRHVVNEVSRVYFVLANFNSADILGIVIAFEAHIWVSLCVFGVSKYTLFLPIHAIVFVVCFQNTAILKCVSVCSNVYIHGRVDQSTPRLPWQNR